MQAEERGKSLGPPPDPVAVLRGHRAAVNAIAFHPTNLLFSGDAQGELRIWDVNRRRAVASSRVHGPNSGVIGIGTSDWLQNRVLSQGRDGTVKCWQLLESSLSREPLLTISTNAYHFCKLSPLAVSTSPAVVELSQEQDSQNTGCAQVVPEGKQLIAIAGEDPAVVEVWDIAGAERVGQLHQPAGQSSSGMCMALQLFVPPGIGGVPNVLVGYEDGTMALWDLKTTRKPRISTRFHTEPVTSLALDASCRGGISGSADDKTIFYTIDFDKDTFITRKELSHGRPGIGDSSVRQDNKIVATGGWDNRVRIYDYRRALPLAMLKYHTASVTGVCFSRDSALLASSSQDTYIALWSIYSSK